MSYDLQPGHNGRGELVRSAQVIMPTAPRQFAPVPPASPANYTLSDYFRIFLSHKLLLGCMLLVGILAGVLLTRAQTKLYRVRTSLVFQDPDRVSFTSSPAQGGGSSGDPDSYIQTQIKILQSETLLSRVAQRMDLSKAGTSEVPNTFMAKIAHAFDFTNPGVVHNSEELAEALGSKMKIRSPDRTQMLEITCDWVNAGFAADFLNNLTTEYINQHIESRGENAGNTTAWLTRELSHLRSELERSEGALQSYARANNLMVVGEKENISDDKVRQAQQEIARAHADRIIKQSQYELASSRPAASLPEVLDNGPIREYQTKLTELKRQLAEITATYTSSHYKVPRLQAQIAELEQTVERERTNIVSRIKNEFEAASQREKLLNNSYERVAHDVNREADRLGRYGVLRREAEANRQLYESMLQKVKEHGIVSALKASHVRTIDHARVPGLLYWPKPSWNIAACMFLSLMAGCVIAVIQERKKSSFLYPGDAAEYLSLADLGAIPKLRASAAAAGNGNGKSLVTVNSLSGNGTVTNGSSNLLAFAKDCTPEADSVRATLASILFTVRQGGQKVLLITSAIPGDGKTTVVRNLGVMLAETGQKVLLIDGDLRKHSLHKAFGIENGLGLSDVLQDDDSVPDLDSSEFTRPTGLPGLHILPGGLHSARAVDMLYSPKWAELMKKVRHDFEIVLIDAPPTLHMPDARVLGRFADAAILVVRAGHTHRDDALAASQRLAQDGIPVLGTILNNWTPARNSYAYASYYKKA